MRERGEVEASGKTVDEAIDRALQQLGLTRNQVECEVLNEGRSGILGLGSEPARVLVRPLSEEGSPTVPEPAGDADPMPAEDGASALTAPATQDDEIAEGVKTLQTLLDLMGLDTAVQSRVPETPGDGAGMAMAVLDVSGNDLGVLIGRRGETLATLQYVLNLIMRRRTHSRITFAVDVEGYRQRREIALRDLAHRLADRVRASGQSVTLEPMPASERRLVHLALADDPDVLTVSIGEGEARKVAITPRR